MSVRHRVSVSVLLVLGAACGGDADREHPAADAATHAPAADSPRMSEANAADIAEVADYRLTMDAVRRMHEAQLGIYDAMLNDPGLAELASMDAEEFSLAGMESRFGSVPEIRDAIEDAGLTVREYGVIMLTLFQASFARASHEMGAPRDTVIAAAQMHPDNLDFIAEHRDELRRMQHELAVAAEAAGNEARSGN